MERLTPAQQRLLTWLEAYIRDHDRAPANREMMQAMGYRSTSPIQNHLKQLRLQGYVDWENRKMRTLRILKPTQPIAAPAAPVPIMPILGIIPAGQPIEPYTDSLDRLDLTEVFGDPEGYALRVAGDSMIDDHIVPGDVVILRRVRDPRRIATGSIVAAFVEGEGTTLKRLYHSGKRVRLEPSNPQYKTIAVDADQVQIQGVMVGLWRVTKH